jgi:hypothetical protein
MKYIVRLENEIIIFGIVFGMVHGWMDDHIKDSQKNPPKKNTSSDVLSLELIYRGC